MTTPVADAPNLADLLREVATYRDARRAFLAVTLDGWDYDAMRYGWVLSRGA